MDLLNALQWPTMVVTVVAAWLVASPQERRRNVGFWLFLFSNGGWIVWGAHTRSWALVVLQVCLATMNIRGAAKSDATSGPPP